jgi:hypothetical protein
MVPRRYGARSNGEHKHAPADLVVLASSGATRMCMPCASGTRQDGALLRRYRRSAMRSTAASACDAANSSCRMLSTNFET